MCKNQTAISNMSQFHLWIFLSVVWSKMVKPDSSAAYILNEHLQLVTVWRFTVKKVIINWLSAIWYWCTVRSIFIYALDILFSSNHNIHKSSCGYINFGECCDLTKKVYLICIYAYIIKHYRCLSYKLT